MSLRSAFSQITYKRHSDRDHRHISHPQQCKRASPTTRISPLVPSLDTQEIATHWNAVGILGANALRFSLALLWNPQTSLALCPSTLSTKLRRSYPRTERVLLLERAHGHDRNEREIDDVYTSHNIERPLAQLRLTLDVLSWLRVLLALSIHVGDTPTRHSLLPDRERL